MPRNGSGTYSLPIGNPVEPNTTIETEWANSTMEDIGNEITNSLSRTGEGGMLAPLRFDDGTDSVPGMAWLTETSSGFYREGTAEFWATVLAEPVLQFTDNGVLVPSGKTLTVQGTQINSGSLDVTGNFAVNTDKFTVAAASGNTVVAGTLGVTGAITATGGVNGNITTSSATITGGTINGTTIGGTTPAAGAFTTLSASGGITGALTGNVTGNLTGNVTGNVSGNAGTVTNGVYTTGNQTIAGTKTFSSTIVGSINGNAATVTNGVYTTGDQTIGGTKTFSSTITGSVSGNAGTVTNGVYTTGSYSDPAWITGLAGSKITGNISGNAGGLSSTLAVSSGGTGQTTYTDGQLLIGNSTGNTLTKATLTAGSGITVTNGNGSITIASTASGGTVTSVDVSGGTTGLTTSGGPVTGSGTITLAGTLGVANGGTGATSLTSGYLVKGNGTSAASASVLYDDGNNIGLGVTPSAWGVDACMEIEGGKAISFANNSGFLCTNAYFNSGWKYITTSTAAQYQQDAGAHKWFTAASGTAGNAITFTQPMTLDASGNLSLTNTGASAFAVGRQGTTNPVLNVDASTASVVTGLNIKGAAAAGGLALSVTSSGTNENLTVDAKGSGTITLGGTSTGAITLTRATTMSAALTYGGVTLSNSVTGTGSMVLSAGPTLTGTLTAAAANFSGIVKSTGGTGGGTSACFVADSANTAYAWKTSGAGTNANIWDAIVTSASTALSFRMVNDAVTDAANWLSVTRTGYTSAVVTFSQPINYGGVTLSNSVTGTGSMVLSANPVFTGGIQVGAPTGGNKGSGTANFAGDIYKNNTAYTNPDYVLEHWATGQIVKFAGKEGAAGYEGLKPLSEVRAFAKENLHLPRFGQSAGHGLFSGSDAILASLEEAYLYIFQLEARISALEENN